MFGKLSQVESNINAYIIAYLEVRLKQASANVVLVIYKRKATGVFFTYFFILIS